MDGTLSEQTQPVPGEACRALLHHFTEGRGSNQPAGAHWDLSCTRRRPVFSASARVTPPPQPGPTNGKSGLRQHFPCTLLLSKSTVAKQSRHYGLPFTDEGTEAQRCQVSWPRSHSVCSTAWARILPLTSNPVLFPQCCHPWSLLWVVRF